jgi:Cu+-exporting ATPase
MSASEFSGPNHKDPVCGMEVTPGSPFHATYKGRDYFFCSRHCLAEFQENPEKIIAPATEYCECPIPPEERRAEPKICPQCGMPLTEVRPKWVCPYHPQVLHDEPGVCPIYGMPLIQEPPGRVYSCDLHPEVKQLEPGKCPLCHMTLWPSWAPSCLRGEWVCPRHPDVVGTAPGNCPKCGLKLEPRKAPEGKPEEFKGVCPKCGAVINS